ILTLLIWIGGAIARRHFRAKLVLTAGQFWLRLAARIGVILQLAVVAGWLALLAWFSQPMALFQGSFDGPLVLLYILGVLGILGGIAIILDALWRIVRGPGGLLCRASEIVLALCAIYGIWAIIAYGLVSFNLHY
ncbi:MAG TPA: serine hydrolase, partial [Rhodanobacteraceae bacterium]|nr:serine hydrolase [Rhodanobacteraceae bacterium]